MSISIDYVAILVQFMVAVGFVAVTLLTIRFAGPRRATSDKLQSWESGVESIGNARFPFSIKYFLTAILFVMFDVEVIFMYPWAVNFRELGMIGFVEMFLFIGTLLIGFGYIIKKGALKWE